MAPQAAVRRVLGATGMAIALACARPGGGSADHEPVTPPSGPLAVAAATDRDTYAPAEPIRLRLTVRNLSPDPVTLDFRSGQQYDFALADSGGAVVWRWSDGRGFIQMLQQRTIPAGDAVVYEEVFDGRLAPGLYTVTAHVTATVPAPLMAQAGLRVR